MGQTLTEIAQQLKDSEKKVHLIYAFNGAGKTRLSREFKELLSPKTENGEETDESRTNILYYNAFTEDLFYWDNDLEGDVERKLKIQPNAYTKWVLEEQGQDQNAISHFQHYTNERLTPRFNEEYKVKGKDDKEIIVPAFSEVTFSFERGNEKREEHIKISKGEESNFIWSIFYSIIEQVIDVRNVAEPDGRETDQFDLVEYIFIDDPVSSLDENHLIELAVHVAQLIKSCDSTIKFILTTHNPLFYNVLYNEFKRNDARHNYRARDSKKYRLEREQDGTFSLVDQPNDSPFSYHLYLKSELEKAIQTGHLQKFHFNFIRNVLEKTATFFGHKNWTALLPKLDDGRPNPYEARIVNIANHSKHAGEEVPELTEDDKRVLGFLVQKIDEMYQLQPSTS